MSICLLQEGTASLKLCCNSDGSGDYSASLEVRVAGYAGNADVHFVGAEWTAFSKAICRLEETRNGDAQLKSAIPGEFQLRVHSIASRGSHIAVSGVFLCRDVGGDESPHQELRFSFEIDSSKLPEFARCVALVQ